MAFVAPLKQDEEDPNQPPLMGAGGIIGTGAAGSAPMPAGAQPTGTSGASGQFTNLQQYLDKNQSQSGKLGDLVAGQVTAQGQAGKTAADALNQQGQQAIESARVPLNQDLVSAAALNPTDVAGDAAKKAEFTKERDAAYGGPKSLEDLSGFGTAQDAVKKASDAATLSATDEGRKQLLTGLRGPTYGPGKATLDNLLLEGNKDATGKVSAAAEPFQHLGDYLTAQDTATQAAAAKAAQEAAATKSAIAERFTGNNGVIPTFGSTLDQKVTAAKTGATGAYASIKAKLDKGQSLTPEELGYLGVSGDDLAKEAASGKVLNQIYGQSIPGLSSFMAASASPDLVTRANAATSEDYARAAALESLMGTGNPLLNPADAAKAGTAYKDVVGFDPGLAKGQTIDNLTGRDQGMIDRAKGRFFNYADKPGEGMLQYAMAGLSPADQAILRTIAGRGGAGGVASYNPADVLETKTGVAGSHDYAMRAALADEAAAMGMSVDGLMKFLNQYGA